MYEIKNINPVSLGKMLAVICGAVFVVSFVIFVFFLIGVGEFGVSDLFDDEFLQIFVIGTIVSVVGSFVGAFIGAHIYNKIAENFGGIKMDIEFHGGQEQKEEERNPYMDGGS